MMKRNILSACGLALLALGTAAPAQAPRLAALAAIEPGEWQFKEASGDVRSVCVSDPRSLLQLRHRELTCARTVISDDPHGLVLNYSCPGAGNGRTVITVETGRLIRLETQGIAGGAPFDLSYQGRRLGACS